MTVSGLELCQTVTTSIASPYKFYPASIAVHHHQLRHFISTAEQDRIYYVNDFDIYVLDLKSKQTTLLATVPFEARCLAADCGWVCVGGEQNGDCAFIRVEQERGIPKCFGHDLNVDVLGGEIVNSMNIHQMGDESGGEAEPIVLISNNDKTVKIYSLAQRQTLTTLRHETPMNFATLSPDSSIIAAVGDSDVVHFYTRSKIEHTSKATGGSRRFPLYDWHSFATPVVPTGDEVYDDYSFAVAFSPSGHMCAASSQGGAITVFDMRTLRADDGIPEEAILCTFRASRPTLCGCVRSMAFSPDPWDLLAWAEDHGRVGIADMRQMFLRRQILELDKTASETVTVADSTPDQIRRLTIPEKLKQQHNVRLQTMRGLSSRDSGDDQNTDDTNNSNIARRLRRQELLYTQSSDLDARERSVLEALETTLDDVGHLNQPYSLNYTSSPRFRPSFTAANNEVDAAMTVNSLVARSGSRFHPPRRRPSVILSESVSNRHLAPIESSRTRISASPGRMTDEDDGIPTMSTNDLTPTARGSTSQPLPYDIPSSDPWHVIQSALEAARQADGNQGSGSDRPATLAQIEAALEAERRLGNQLERQLSDERQLSTLLRRQLETQERLLQSQQRELEVEREAGRSSEQSLEMLLQRELEIEQQYGEQRSQELETEIRLGSNRARRLESERVRLINAITQGEAYLGTSDTSAHSTTLPLTNVRSTSQNEGLAATLQRHELYRRQRLAHVEELQQQVRRAEARVASASSDIQALESAIQRGVVNDREARQSEARARAVANGGASISGIAAVDVADFSSGLRTRTVRRIAEQAERASAAGVSPRSSTRLSELSGRATEAEMRLARMMFLNGPRGVDNNGNWIAGNALHRVLGRAANGTGAEGPSPADILREVGIGTTGIGWSPDGRFLYAGSEEGVFEFKINMRDRMTFPGIEMR